MRRLDIDEPGHSLTQAEKRSRVLDLIQDMSLRFRKTVVHKKQFAAIE